MEKPKNTVITKQKFSRAVATGFECQSCKVTNVTYDEKPPTECLNCKSPVLVQKWQEIVTNQVTIEKII